MMMLRRCLSFARATDEISQGYRGAAVLMFEFNTALIVFALAILGMSLGVMVSGRHFKT
jgi:hypothetical protein